MLVVPDDGFLIIGLGNPGLKYSGTRHNFGFMLLDGLQQKMVPPGSFKKVKEYQAEIRVGKLVDKPVCLFKPQTYMNLSGRAVQAALANPASIDLGKVIVVYDDLDLELGRIKLKKGGGSGGHNGLRSLIETFASPDFLRLRLGISGSLRGLDTIDYVLSSFAKNEIATVSDVLNRGVEGLLLAFASGVNMAMNQINRRVLPPQE